LLLSRERAKFSLALASDVNSHALEWRFIRDNSGDSGEDCGWVDFVQWTQVPSVQNPNNWSTITINNEVFISAHVFSIQLARLSISSLFCHIFLWDIWYAVGQEVKILLPYPWQYILLLQIARLNLP